MDAFGQNPQNLENGKTISVKSSDIKNIGVREFVDKAETLGVERVFVSDLDSSELDELLTKTPSVLFNPEKISTDIEFIGGDRYIT